MCSVWDSELVYGSLPFMWAAYFYVVLERYTSDKDLIHFGVAAQLVPEEPRDQHCRVCESKLEGLLHFQESFSWIDFLDHSEFLVLASIIL